MTAFAYSNSPYPIRADLVDAYRATWHALAGPGAWWTGAERIAIARASRAAPDCKLCQASKAALSPYGIAGEHTAEAHVRRPALDLVHRLVTDPSRLSRGYVDALAGQGLPAGHYVETIGIVVAVLSIDSFHRALGFEPEPLPEPRAGRATNYTPPGARRKAAWVPMIESLRKHEQDLWPADGMVPNVLKALSLVPDAVRSVKLLSVAQYVPVADVGNPGREGDRAISRAQIEFIAARVSALNDCFY